MQIKTAFQAILIISYLSQKVNVDLRGLEPLTFCMPYKRSTS